MRLLHLTTASAERSIRRSGLRAPVFAMPVLPDWSVTHQWVRELRRWHGKERMVAVHVRVPDEEPVLVGRHGTQHARMTAAEAAERVRRRPAGAEIIVERAITKRDVIAVREISQLVGWTERPETTDAPTCLCAMCRPARGVPERRRRIRAEYMRNVDLLARSSDRSRRGEAANRIAQAADAARGALEPKHVLRFVADADPWVRESMAEALGTFALGVAAEPLVRLLADPVPRVRAVAASALVRSAGPARADAISGGHSAVRNRILTVLVYCKPTRSLATLLERLEAEMPADPRIAETARAWRERA